MMLMAMYAMEWERRAQREKRWQVEADRARLACLLWSARQAEQPEEQVERGILAFSKFVSALGYVGR